jgi:NAD(P)-dependent dehydrogenase (short-subunit alcohol dehydrogenase family)
VSAPRRSGTPDARPLAGVRAVVTGGGSGIGLAIARRLRSMGASLVLSGRERARLDRALETLGAGPDDRALACDVGDAEAVAGAFRVLADGGRVPQILVNNAGFAKSAKFSEMSPQAWDETLRVNLSGVFHCTRAALPGLVAAPFGRVVNVASTAGLAGYPYVVAYCAAKHGVVGFTRALALELARTRVTVNAVCPGYTETGLIDGAIATIVATTGRTAAQAREALEQRNPQRRLVTPDEVADAVAWLCLPASQAVTGQAVSISGGEVMTG